MPRGATRLLERLYYYGVAAPRGSVWKWPWRRGMIIVNLKQMFSDSKARMPSWEGPVLAVCRGPESSSVGNANINSSVWSIIRGMLLLTQHPGITVRGTHTARDGTHYLDWGAITATVTYMGTGIGRENHGGQFFSYRVIP